MLDPDFLYRALIYFQGRSATYDPDLTQFLAAARTKGTIAQRFSNNVHCIFSNFVQETLDQATPPGFVVFEQHLAATALHFDDSIFDHVSLL